MIEEVYPGIEVDPDKRIFMVCGQMMAVGHLERSPYAPGRIVTADQADRRMDNIIEGVTGHRRTYPHVVRPSPAVIHVNLLCGENGWWVEAAVWLGDPEYPQGLTIGLPEQQYDPSEDNTAEDLLLLWKSTCACRDAPSTEYTDAGCGMALGSWEWNDD